ncbi:nucleic acid-binding OB-fold-like protein, partial [Trifolium medium]|nr:nucleic acid-binding OB-fold-like protein [Trifolium medium]
NFVVVDESGKKEALESGSKVGCIVVQVLVYAQCIPVINLGGEVGCMIK